MYLRGLIFDLDDTLYPHQRFVRSGLTAVAGHVERRFGIPVGEALRTMAAVSNAGRSGEFQALCRRFGLDGHVVSEMLTVFRAHEPSLWFFHDAESTLRRLRDEGWRLALLTNGHPDIQERKVRALGVRAFVDHVVFAADHAEGGKPGPTAFHEALRRLGVPANRCAMVGDDEECDIRGARDVGIRTIRIVRGEARSSSCGDAEVRCLEAVPEVAESLVPRLVAHAA